MAKQNQNKKQKGKRKGTAIGKFYIIVLSAYVAVTGITLFYHYNQALSLRAIKKGIETEIEEENRLNISLNNKLIYYDTDSYIESAAREKLNFVKPNEIIFIDRNK